MKDLFLDVMVKYSKDNYALECWNEIQTNYNATARYYHNLQHLKNMLTDLEAIKHEVIHLDVLLFSIFYHDIIYNTTKSNNEYESALILKKRLSKTNFKMDNITICMNQIEATKHHQFATQNDTNILLDLDLSILGKTEKEYKEYAKNIRKEYKIYPNFMYKKGRKKVLKAMLEKKSIYKTTCFINKYEEIAIRNLKAEFLELS